MSPTKLVQWSGLALIASGVSFALFVLVHPFGEFDIATIANTGRWAVAHNLHIIGMVLLLLGLVGLYARQVAQTGTLGLAGFLVAFAGTALTAGAVFSAIGIFPTIASNAPQLVASDSPLFTTPNPIFLVSAVAWIVGYVLFGVALLRANVLPRAGSALFLAGALLFSIPPEPIGPVPYVVPFLGALAFGVGLAWLGLALWGRLSAPMVRRAAPAPAR